MILGLWKTKNMMTVTVRTMDRLQSLFCCCSLLLAASEPDVARCSMNYSTIDNRPLKYVVKHKSAKLLMTYAEGKLEAALNMSHLILRTSSQRVR